MDMCTQIDSLLDPPAAPLPAPPAPPAPTSPLPPAPTTQAIVQQSISAQESGGMKDAIVVVLAGLFVNSGAVQSLLSKHVPALYNEHGSNAFGVILSAILVGLLFLISRYLSIDIRK